jgi:hypothetical protein
MIAAAPVMGVIFPGCVMGAKDTGRSLRFTATIV